MKILRYMLCSFLAGLCIVGDAAGKDEQTSDPVIYATPPAADEDFLSTLQNGGSQNKPADLKEDTPKAPTIELPPVIVPAPAPTPVVSPNDTPQLPVPEKDVTTPLPAPDPLALPAVSKDTVQLPKLEMPTLIAPSPVPTVVKDSGGASEVSKEAAQLPKLEMPALIPPSVAADVTVESKIKVPSPSTVTLTPPAEKANPSNSPPDNAFTIYDKNAAPNVVDTKNTQNVMPLPLPSAQGMSDLKKSSNDEKSAEKKKADDLIAAEKEKIAAAEKAKTAVPKKKISKQELQQMQEEDMLRIRQEVRAEDKRIAAEKIWRQDALNYKTQNIPKDVYSSKGEENSHLRKPLSPTDYTNALFVAVEEGNLDAIRALLRGGGKVEDRGEDGNTPLIYATAQGQLDAVRLLLGKNAHVNATNSHNGTALHVASAMGNTDIARALLSMASNPNLRDESGKTALHYAVDNGDVELVKMLILNQAKASQKENGGKTALDYAIAKGDSAMLAAVLTTKLDKATLNSGFIAAIMAQRIDLASVFLQKGASINAKTPKGYTPLMIAVINWQDGIVDLLLKKGADPRIKNNEGMTASALAEAQGNFALAEILQLEEVKRGGGKVPASNAASTYKPIPSKVIPPKSYVAK